MSTIRLILHGKAAARPAIRAAVQKLREQGTQLEVRVTWEAGDTQRLAREAVADGVSIVVAGKADDPASFMSWSVWLVPFRNVAIGLLLAGIVLALVTIGDVLRFQWKRIDAIAFTQPTGDIS